jgi:hypothetical protein
LIGLTFAVRTARRVTKAERAMRALATRPGWRLAERSRGDGAPSLRLERHWSAARLNLRVPKDVPYLPMSDDLNGMAERLHASDLVERLVKLAAPAVSVSDDSACFVFFPLPEVRDMDGLLEGLAALLPDLIALARATAQEGDAGRA